MTATRTITAEWLKSNNFSASQYAIFCAEWPNGCEVTHDNLLRAAAMGLDMEWFAKRVLPPKVYADYHAKRAATLYADYQRYRSALYADYESCRAALYADSQDNRAALYADYEDKDAPLFAAYESSRAAMFADYRAKDAPLYSDYQRYRAALLISTLLNHYDALPAINAAGGN